MKDLIVIILIGCGLAFVLGAEQTAQSKAAAPRRPQKRSVLRLVWDRDAK